MNKRLNPGPINVCHFVNGHYGGVYHVVSNLIKYSSNPFIKHYIFYTIDQEQFPDWQHQSIGSNSIEYIFNYSRYENIYHVFRRLAKRIPQDAVLIAHDWFELGMVSTLGLTNRVIYMLHGNHNYYFDLLEKHHSEIDTVLCISQQSYTTLVSGDKKYHNLHYYRFPVLSIQYKKKDFDVLRIAVIAENLKDENKGISQIKAINKELELQSVQVEWHLAGKGFSFKDLKEWWGGMNNLPNYYGYLKQDELADYFARCNVYVLPSLKEGVPVSLIESMKSGLIPILTNWSDNVANIVIDGITGFILKNSTVMSYVNALISIKDSPELSTVISAKASELTCNLFNPYDQVESFERYLNFYGCKQFTAKRKVYGSRLDHPFIPNIITRSLRKLLK